MRFDCIVLRRVALIYGRTILTGGLATGFFAPQAQAAQPMITDDAGVVDPKACQVESGPSQRVTLPAIWK